MAWFIYLLPSAAEKSVMALQQDLQGTQKQILELQKVVASKDKEIASLHSNLSLVQARCLEKIKVSVTLLREGVGHR